MLRLQDLSRETRTMTIIFKPRISNDADLEVGNLIRIHSPWYEFLKFYHYINLQG